MTTSYPWPYYNSGQYVLTLDTSSHISDHKPTFILLPFEYEIKRPFSRQVWMDKNAKFSLLKQKITNHDWNFLNEGTIDEACNKISNTLIETIETCIPSNTVIIWPDDKPWNDSEKRHFTLKRDRLNKKSKFTNNPFVGKKYKKQYSKIFYQK